MRSFLINLQLTNVSKTQKKKKKMQIPKEKSHEKNGQLSMFRA